MFVIIRATQFVMEMIPAVQSTRTTAMANPGCYLPNAVAESQRAVGLILASHSMDMATSRLPETLPLNSTTCQMESYSISFGPGSAKTPTRVVVARTGDSVSIIYSAPMALMHKRLVMPHTTVGTTAGIPAAITVRQFHSSMVRSLLTISLSRLATFIPWSDMKQFPDQKTSSTLTPIPRTHVGALAEYDAGRGRTVYGGWTAGWDNGFDNFHDASTFLGGIRVERGNATITWIVIAGDIGTGFTFAGENDSYMNSIVVDFAVTDRLTYVLQHDLGVVSSSSSQKAEWYGLNQYLLYSINDCWAAGLRFEWFRDDDGVRVDPNGDSLNAGSYYELTAGLNWRPHANINVRPELRWDWYDGRGGNVYDDGDHNRLFTASIDAILTF